MGTEPGYMLIIQVPVLTWCSIHGDSHAGQQNPIVPIVTAQSYN